MVEKMNEMLEQETPKNGKCHCGGGLVRRAQSMSCSGFHYGFPQCVICGREYLNCDENSIPTTGEEELRKIMGIEFSV